MRSKFDPCSADRDLQSQRGRRPRPAPSWHQTAQFGGVLCALGFGEGKTLARKCFTLIGDLGPDTPSTDRFGVVQDAGAIGGGRFLCFAEDSTCPSETWNALAGHRRGQRRPCQDASHRSMPFLSSNEAATSHPRATNGACGAVPADDTIASCHPSARPGHRPELFSESVEDGVLVPPASNDHQDEQNHRISQAQKSGMRHTHLERAIAAPADGPQAAMSRRAVAWSESDSEPVPPA